VLEERDESEGRNEMLTVRTVPMRKKPTRNTKLRKELKRAKKFTAATANIGNLEFIYWY